jgi:formaldehyde-activating enzyme involved in methanogenesis
MTIKIGELRGELLAIATSKGKSQQRVTRAIVEVLANIRPNEYGEAEVVSKVAVSVPIDLDQYDELAEHVGRKVRVSFEVFPEKS